jgi:hypothetical protein
VICKTLLRKETSQNFQTTLQRVSDWRADDDPPKGVLPVFEMLLACVDDESALDAQGCLHKSVAFERRRIKNRRACIQMIAMLLRCTDERYCGPQAALGILLNDHLPRRIMQFLSSMRLTLSPSGLDYLLKKFRERLMQLTGMRWEDREQVERARLQLVPLQEGKIRVHIVLADSL